MDIIEIKKNMKEIIKITKDNYNGYDVCSIRVFITDGDKKYPTRKGITFKVELLDEIIKALKTIQNKR